MKKLISVLKPKYIALTLGLLVFAHSYYLAAKFFETHKLQSPIVLQAPWTDRFVSPVDIKATPMQDVIKPTVAPKPSPTPVKKKSALKIDLVRDVMAAETEYPYESKILYMDAGQREVMRQVENTLGKAYAELIFRESGFHSCSINGIGNDCDYMGTRAGGLGQANPRTKMDCDLRDVPCQLIWVKKYTEGRYGTVDKALSFHNAHGWY